VTSLMRSLYINSFFYLASSTQCSNFQTQTIVYRLIFCIVVVGDVFVVIAPQDNEEKYVA
jgi:hypothetical protein